MEETKIESTQENPGVSRRYFVKGAGIIAGGLAVGSIALVQACTNNPSTTPPPTTTAPPTTPPPTTTPASAETYMFFNSTEAATIKAAFSRLIPGSASDPGAVEAGAHIYIDRQLNGYLANKGIANGVPLPTMQTAYNRGLSAMDTYSKSKYSGAFASLTTTQQDAVLTDMQNGATTGAFTVPSDSLFFGLLLGHCREGTFCDPLYGGNVNLVGWKMLGFPGAQVAYTDAQMAIGFNQATISQLTLADTEKIIEPSPTGPSAGF